jgi:hydrogenase maturation protease
MKGRVLIACVGNIFLGDDGFGVEVARRLAAAELPDGVKLVDYGTGGMHLAYDMADGYQTTILVDAAPRGGEPGTVTVIEVDPAEHPNPAAALGALQGSMLFDGHGMQPDVVFGILEMLGGKAGRILVVGCEPASTGYGMELSEPVAAAVGEAARIVLDLAAAEAAAPAATSTADSVTADSVTADSVTADKG